MQEETPTRAILAVSLLSALEFLVAWNDLWILYAILLSLILVTRRRWPRAASLAEAILAVAALSSSKAM